MPLTVSHVASVLPLRRLRLPNSALIIGSMVPDFEFFLRLTDERLIAHTFKGIFIFCLPVGLVSLYIFHRYLKFPLFSLLPHSHQGRLIPLAGEFKFYPFRRLIMIVSALLMGILLHFTWDGWTHGDGLFVQLFPALTQPVCYFADKWHKVYDLVGYFSSIGGIFATAWVYYRWYKRAPVHRPQLQASITSRSRIAIGAGMGCFACFSGITYGFVSVPLAPLKPFIALSMVVTVSAFLAAWIVFCFIWHMRFHRQGGASR